LFPPLYLQFSPSRQALTRIFIVARSVFQILNLLPILPRFWALKKRILLFLSQYREVRRILLHQIALFNPFLCAENTNRPRLLFRVPACFQLENAQ